jgi:hypothetical protein
MNDEIAIQFRIQSPHRSASGSCYHVSSNVIEVPRQLLQLGDYHTRFDNVERINRQWIKEIIHPLVIPLAEAICTDRGSDIRRANDLIDAIRNGDVLCVAGETTSGALRSQQSLAFTFDEKRNGHFAAMAVLFPNAIECKKAIQQMIGTNLFEKELTHCVSMLWL